MISSDRFARPFDRASAYVRQLTADRAGPKRIIWTNAAIEAEYHRRLTKLIDRMHRSVVRWISAAYRARPPEMAQDESPARALDAVCARLARYWTGRFDDMSADLARWFADEVSRRSDAALKAILRRGGMSVKFDPTRAQNDVMQAVIAENVGLIRSIPVQHLDAVRGHVMRSVAAGRDLETLATALREQFGVTKRRAALISRDQNNKATAEMTRQRQLQVGIRRAVWMHSGGGKEPRPSHLKAGRDRVVFDLDKGWFDPDEEKFVLPGQLVNCRCTSRPVLEGFS